MLLRFCKTCKKMTDHKVKKILRADSSVESEWRKCEICRKSSMWRHITCLPYESIQEKIKEYTADALPKNKNKMDERETRSVTLADWQAEKRVDKNFMPLVQFENEYCYVVSTGEIHHKPWSDVKTVMIDPHIYYDY